MLPCCGHRTRTVPRVVDAGRRRERRLTQADWQKAFRPCDRHGREVESSTLRHRPEDSSATICRCLLRRLHMENRTVEVGRVVLVGECRTRDWRTYSGGDNILELVNVAKKNFEIGRVLHLKSEIRNCKLDCHQVGRCEVQSEISNFGFEMQDLSNFEILRLSLRRLDVLIDRKQILRIVLRLDS